MARPIRERVGATWPPGLVRVPNGLSSPRQRPPVSPVTGGRCPSVLDRLQGVDQPRGRRVQSQVSSSCRARRPSLVTSTPGRPTRTTCPLPPGGSPELCPVTGAQPLGGPRTPRPGAAHLIGMESDPQKSIGNLRNRHYTHRGVTGVAPTWRAAATGPDDSAAPIAGAHSGDRLRRSTQRTCGPAVHSQSLRGSRALYRRDRLRRRCPHRRHARSDRRPGPRRPTTPAAPPCTESGNAVTERPERSTSAS